MKTAFKVSTTLALLTLASAAHAVNFVAVTTDNRLTQFDSAAPTATSSFVSITGMTAGARLIGIDTRPTDGMIWASAPTTRSTPSTR